MVDISLKTKKITQLDSKNDPTGMKFAICKDPSGSSVGHNTYYITYEDLKAKLSADLA